jgi:hypothetical protein
LKFDPERVKFEDENITFFSARNGKASPDIKDVSDKYVSPLFRSYGLLPSLVVRKDMDVNEHERLSNITLRHKLK